MFNDEQTQGRRNACRITRGAKKINNTYRLKRSGGRGRPHRDLDSLLNGMWWVLCTGSMWNQMPERFGKWNSVWRTFRRWCKSGLWAWMLEHLSEKHARYSLGVMLDCSHIKVHQDATRYPANPDKQCFGKTKGGRNTKLSAAVNLAGLPVSLKLVPGNEHDIKSAVPTLRGHVSGNFVLADRGYDSDALRQFIREQNGFAVIPPKRNRTRKIRYDKRIGKLRHRVENYFAKMKRYRRLATRYDKLPETYMGFVTLAALKDWIKFDFVHTA